MWDSLLDLYLVNMCVVKQMNHKIFRVITAKLFK